MRVRESVALVLLCVVAAVGCSGGGGWSESTLARAVRQATQTKSSRPIDRALLMPWSRRPNLRDLHGQDGALALAQGLQPGPAMDPDRVMRRILAAAGREDLSQGFYGVWLGVDHAEVDLPPATHRTGIPRRCALVSMDREAVIRVSTGEEMSLPVSHLEEVVTFSSTLVAVNLDLGPDPALAELDVGGLEVREVPVGRREAASGVVAGPDTALRLVVSPEASCADLVATLDSLRSERSPTLVVLCPARRELEVWARLEPWSATPSAAGVVLKLDGRVPGGRVLDLLDALHRSRVGTTMLLTTLDLERCSPTRETFPGGLLGGLELELLPDASPGRARATGTKADPWTRARAGGVSATGVTRSRELPFTGIRRFVEGGSVTEPRKLLGAPPTYGEAARRAGITGAVVLDAVIRVDGTVGKVEVLRGLPLGLSESAVEAVRRWRFEPARLDGTPVEVLYTITVRFERS